MDINKQLDTFFLTELKKVIPDEIQLATKKANKSKLYIDDSTKIMGYSKVTKKGYMP